MSRMTLANVRSGPMDKPLRVLLYGTEGVGKTTFGAAAPSPVFLGVESGGERLDIDRFPEPKNWGEIHEAIQTLTREKHDRKTLVIDTLDWIEPLCWAETCRQAGESNIDGRTPGSNFGYHKGYDAAVDTWRELLAALEILRNTAGMNLVLLAHAWVKTFKNPLGEDFDRYQMKLNQKAAGLLTEWPDAVLFADYEDHTYRPPGASDKTLAKGINPTDGGARILHTQRRATWVAKNRYDLPARLPLDWHAFVAAIGKPAEPAALVAELEQLKPSLPDARQKVLANAINKCRKSAVKLTKLVDRVKAEIGIAS